MSSLPKTVTRHRRDYDLNLGLLCLSPAVTRAFQFAIRIDSIRYIVILN